MIDRKLIRGLAIAGSVPVAVAGRGVSVLRSITCE